MQVQSVLDVIQHWILWLWALAKAHPAVTTPVIGALVTLLFKSRTPAQYASLAARNPVWFFTRLAAMLQLIGAIFPDPVKAQKVVMKVILGTQDDPPPTNPSA